MYGGKFLNNRHTADDYLAAPFFAVLAILTVVSFCIPLRPVQSQMERRNLARFPAFSAETLMSGEYFDDISLWFSDTFPGREGWLKTASFTKSLHGSSELAIEGDLPMELAEVPKFQDTAAAPTEPMQPEELPPEEPIQPPAAAVPTEPEEPTEEPAPVEESSEPPAAAAVPAEPEEPTEKPAHPVEESSEPTVAAEQPQPETEPTKPAWGGVNAANDEDILWSDTTIQIGDAAFGAIGFSESSSLSYIQTINRFAAAAAAHGITVVSAPPPTAVGILVEEEFQYKLRSSSQTATLQFLHDGMDDRVVKVDTVSALLAHNSEYVYFRTDHHWTALGAYYAYEAMCKAMGMEPVDIASLETVDMGVFQGSLYGRVRNPRKLKNDRVYAYVPKGDLVNTVYNSGNYGDYMTYPVLATEYNWGIDTKYAVFGGDWPMNRVENRSLPDGPTCIVVKDSFGNCMVPFLTQNFQNVYAVDYRKFFSDSLLNLAVSKGADYVLFIPYLTATQSTDAAEMFRLLCR